MVKGRGLQKHPYPGKGGKEKTTLTLYSITREPNLRSVSNKSTNKPNNQPTNQTNKQTDRQTNKQTNKQTGKQKGRMPPFNQYAKQARNTHATCVADKRHAQQIRTVPSHVAASKKSEPLLRPDISQVLSSKVPKSGRQGVPRGHPFRRSISEKFDGPSAASHLLTTLVDVCVKVNERSPLGNDNPLHQ